MVKDKKKMVVAVILIIAAVFSILSAAVGMLNAKNQCAKKVSMNKSLISEIASAEELAESMMLSDVVIGGDPVVYEEPVIEQPEEASEEDLIDQMIAELEAAEAAETVEENAPQKRKGNQPVELIDKDAFISEFEASLGRQLSTHEMNKLSTAVDDYNALALQKNAYLDSLEAAIHDSATTKKKYDSAVAAKESAQAAYNEALNTPAKFKAEYDAAVAKTASAESAYQNAVSTAEASKAAIPTAEANLASAQESVAAAKAAYDKTNSAIASYNSAKSEYDAATAQAWAALLSGDTAAYNAATAAQAAAQSKMNQILASAGAYSIDALRTTNSINKTAYDSAVKIADAAQSSLDKAKAKAVSDEAAIATAKSELESARSAEAAAKAKIGTADGIIAEAKSKLDKATGEANTCEKAYNTNKNAQIQAKKDFDSVPYDKFDESMLAINELKTDILNSDVKDEEIESDQTELLSSLMDIQSSDDREKLDTVIDRLLQEKTVKAVVGSNATYSEVCEAANDYFRSHIDKANKAKTNSDMVALVLMIAAITEIAAAVLVLVSRNKTVGKIMCFVGSMFGAIGIVMFLIFGSFTNALLPVGCAVACIAGIVCVIISSGKIDLKVDLSE